MLVNVQCNHGHHTSQVNPTWWTIPIVTCGSNDGLWTDTYPFIDLTVGKIKIHKRKGDL